MKTNRTPIQVYALVVCFAALVCFVITLGIALYDIVQITLPEFTYRATAFSIEPNFKPGTTEYRDAIEGEKNRAARSLTKTAIILLIDLGVFVVHWRIANRPHSSYSLNS